MKRRTIVAISLGVLILLVGGTVLGIRQYKAATFVPLPEVSEIAEMRVDVGNLRRIAEDDESGEGEYDEYKFIVPKEHWQLILDSLAPHERTLIGATQKGAVIGSIQIKMHDGKTTAFTILVFFHENRMIFSLGPEQLEHIGGDKRALYEAIKTAHTAAAKK